MSEKVVLYGMSFRHPKAFAILNNFARLHVGRERAFNITLAWHQLLQAAQTEGVSRDFHRLQTGSKAQEEYKRAVSVAESVGAISCCLYHDSHLTVIFKSEDYARALAGVGFGRAAKLSRNQCKSLRPFDAEGVDAVRAEYTRALA